MAHNHLAEMRDIQFVLFEMLDVRMLTGFDRFSGCDRDLIMDTLALAEKIAREKLHPVDGPADEEGLRYDPVTMSVTVPDIAHEPYRAMAEAGFIALTEAPEIGGMGMPQCVSLACREYFCAASAALAFFTLLTGSAAGLVRRFGSDEQKGLYLEKMLRGQWSGTMCLTEPGAGSDVGGIRTRAVRGPDGSFRIEGQKIFISAGEHDLTENIVHMVLARVEGAPAGTRGLSLFIVPKYLPGPDGSPAERNGVFCRGVEKKMGFHGSPTCALSFGEESPCTGFLLGKEGSGMRLMFRMMNEERLYCGLQGLAASSAAYLYAVDYARSRIQGPRAEKLLDPSAERVAIIEHSDVKRMLLWMRSHVEAMRMLTYYLGLCLDLSEAGTGEEAREADAMVEILVPICKAGNTDLVWLVTAEAIQVHGGYGFCRDYPVERLARECKVLSIVEGTNGIQSMDLVLRKILLDPGQKNYSVLKKHVAGTIEKARPVVDGRYLDMLDRAVDRMDGVVSLLRDHMARGRIGQVLALATLVQQAMYMLCLAWMHVWSLSIALPKLQALSGSGADASFSPAAEAGTEQAFYRGKVLASRFYLGTEFPGYFGRIEGILGGEEAVDLSDAADFPA